MHEQTRESKILTQLFDMARDKESKGCSPDTTYDLSAWKQLWKLSYGEDMPQDAAEFLEHLLPELLEAHKQAAQSPIKHSEVQHD